jgi:hypothetical protein
MLSLVVVLAASLLVTGTVHAAKGGKPGKPPDDPPTPEPPANPEIVLNFDYKSGPYFGVIDADGSNETPIFFEGFEPGPHHLGTWSPDGQRLAMQVYTGSQELWSSNLDGTNAVQLVDGGLMDTIEWSPATDSSLPSFNKVAYCDSWTGDILMIDADGGQPQIVLDSNYPDEGYYWYTDPSWSPDGSRLAAFRRTGSDVPDQIVAVTVGSNDAPDVLFESQDYPGPWGLDWARQHNWMAFHEQVDGVTTVVVLDLDSGTVHQIASMMRDPSWSQDDSKLLMATVLKHKVEKNIVDNHLYVYEGFNESDFSGGSLTFIHHGHWAEWKRCVTQEDGTCLIP